MSRLRASMQAIDEQCLEKANLRRTYDFTKQVLKACNIIRPSVSVLSTLPISRRQAKVEIRK